MLERVQEHENALKVAKKADYKACEKARGMGHLQVPATFCPAPSPETFPGYNKETFSMVFPSREDSTLFYPALVMG